MSSQNKVKAILNPFEGKLQLTQDLELGFSVKNVAKAPFVVLDGYTRTYPNLWIPDDMEIEVEEGGELIVL